MTDDVAPIHRGPRGVPGEVLHELVQRGLTNAQINEHLVAEGYIGKPLSRQALSGFRQRHGYAAQRVALPGRERLIPWVVASKDREHRYHRCLELVVRDRAGRSMRDKDRDRMDKFVRELFEADAVIHNDRVNGWRAVKPRAGVDRDLIRDPRLDDNGQHVDFDPYA